MKTAHQGRPCSLGVGHQYIRAIEVSGVEDAAIMLLGNVLNLAHHRGYKFEIDAVVNAESAASKRDHVLYLLTLPRFPSSVLTNSVPEGRRSFRLTFRTSN